MSLDSYLELSCYYIRTLEVLRRLKPQFNVYALQNRVSLRNSLVAEVHDDTISDMKGFTREMCESIPVLADIIKQYPEIANVYLSGCVKAKLKLDCHVVQGKKHVSWLHTDKDQVDPLSIPALMYEYSTFSETGLEENSDPLIQIMINSINAGTQESKITVFSRDGKYHREGGPAVEIRTRQGDMRWDVVSYYRRGLLHNYIDQADVDKLQKGEEVTATPAITSTNSVDGVSTKEYWRDGRLLYPARAALETESGLRSIEEMIHMVFLARQ